MTHRRSDVPKAPESLHPAAEDVWRWVTANYDLHVGDLEVLGRACVALTRARAAEAVLQAEGLTTLNRFGETRPHPCDEIARANATLYEKLLRVLNLAPEDTSEPWKARR